MDETSNQRDKIAEAERYRLLVEAITDYAVFMLEPTGIVASWNPGAARFKGYAASEVIGGHFSRFYTAEDRLTGLPERALATAAEVGRFEGEGWRVRKDGNRFWASVVIDAIEDPDGRLIGFAKVTRDLTERRNAEEALRRSEEQFRLLVQGVTDYAIYMLDPTGRVTSWNAGAERIKGYRESDVVGSHFSRFYTADDQAIGLPATALGIAAAEGRFEREGWRVRKDGTLFMAHVVIDAVRDEAGDLIGFAKVTRDITERVRAQQQLDQMREALFQSQKLEAIGQLSGGVAHDYNNLLAAILGGLTLLRKRYDVPEAHALLDNLFRAAERGVSLTKRLLAFARRQDLKTEIVDVPELVLGMRDMTIRTLGPNIVFSELFERGPLRVMTDPHQLETALLNLVLNARDAMPAGGTIEVSAARAASAEPGPGGLPPGRFVRIGVCDTGEGMDAATLARAAEPFFTTKGVGKGTGLGLSMVHGFAEQSRGRIAITSEPGRGTTVELWLPEVSEEDAARPSPEPAAPPPLPAKPIRILLVDDDELVLSSTAAMLEDLGHHVVRASSGQDALSELQRNPDVDLLITDQAMPRMAGLDLLRCVRSLRPDLAAILATGFAEFPDGVADTIERLAKPYTQLQVEHAIGRAMQTKAGA